MLLFRLLILLSSSWCVSVVVGVLPSAKIDVVSSSSQSGAGGGSMSTTTMLASEGGFGSVLTMDPEESIPMVAMLPPPDNLLLCTTPTFAAVPISPPQVLLVGRGGCTFEQKAMVAQQLGASAIIIYGTLASRYSLNTTTTTSTTSISSTDIVYPQDKVDYDCDKASLSIPLNQLSFDPLPYNSAINDRQLISTNEGGINTQLSNQVSTCPSQRALLTGKTTLMEGGIVGQQEHEQYMEACCAWDLHIYLYPDPAIHNNADAVVVTIPALYITMQQGHFLLNAILQQNNNDSPLLLSMYRRYEPEYNLSAFLIWALGVFVAALASYLSASDYRHAKHYYKTTQQQQQQQSDDSVPSAVMMTTNNTTIMGNGANGTRNRSKSPPKADTTSITSTDTTTTTSNDDEDTASSSSQRRQQQLQSQPSSSFASQKEEEMELTVGHALGFVVFSSAGLLTLFFFKIYAVVKVFYAIGCSSAILQVIFLPLYQTLLIRKLKLIKDDQHLLTLPCDLGPVSISEFLALFTSYGLGGYWLFLSFTLLHPDTNLFYWIMQDIMGACMCITFLNTIKLNSIKVASVLLIVAFFYDIFFVFISPLLTRGNESIMITVATSGGPPKASPGWCEKYPNDADCRGGDPLPMLFTIPRLNDYRGGSSLLGLGDIVLPGLLLSFAARFDEAKRLLGTIRGGGSDTNNNSSSSSRRRQFIHSYCGSGGGGCWNGGYFPSVVIAYGIGLFMANAAVYLMNYGQPALLYLVPCCLGTICFMGYRRGELSELWETPRILQAADSILHGETNHNNNNSGFIGNSNDDVEEAKNETGNAPLLNLT